MNTQRVKKFYDQSVNYEWSRLSHDYYSQIEFEVSKFFIQNYLTPDSKVIDIGGGPGRYTIDLLKKGNKVTLIDLSPELLKKAKDEIDKQDLHENLIEIYERSAVNLHGIEDEQFDITLIFGPLYHLLNIEDQKKALLEARRVTKKGGYIFTSIITRLSPIKDCLTWAPESTRSYLLNKNKELDDILNLCKYENISEDPNNFTDAYFAHTDHVPNLYKKLNINLVESFSCEGIAAFMNDKINNLVNDKTTWNKLLDLIIKTSTEPSILGSGEHAVFIGRK